MSSNTVSGNISTDPIAEGPLVLLSSRYKVLSILGDGGFGKTFLVEDTHMPSSRRCVLKQLKPIHNKPDLRQMVQDRFQREAATLEKLGEAHDQIPRLHAYFSEGDQFYLVEEWVEGMTLTQKVEKEGPLQEATVQAIITKLLDVVAYVHSQKIVHRDIKPDNIILRQWDGQPVLIDFGAVKETMKTVINSGEQSTHSIVVGTPGYMPSEQLSGRPIYASDVYSLGMTAIFLLTGKIPQELHTAPQTGSLSWREQAAGLSAEFANFLDCATHMSPQSRFSTVQDMQFALNALMMSQLSTQMPVPLHLDGATNANSIAPTAAPRITSNVTPKATPETVTQSAQTVASAAPTASDPEISATVVSGPSSTDSNQPSTNAYARRNSIAQSSSAQSSISQSSISQWKGPAIIGGIVGISIVLGAFVFTERFPTVMDNSSGSSETTVTDITETDVTETDITEASTDDIESSALNKPAEMSDSSSRQPNNVRPSSQPTTPAIAPNANGTVVGQGDSKNVRAGAGINYSVIDSVLGGDRIQAVDRADDAEGYPWYQVMTPSGKRGWIAGQLIQIDGDATLPRSTTKPRPTPTPTTTPSPAPADRTNATIVGQKLDSKNIRSGPGTNYSTAHVAYPGDRIIVQDSAQDSGGYTWYKVSFPESGAEGWIASQLVNRD
ncbi:MAG: SH3 domain-containing protein [Phormidesmis sp.]